MIVVYAAPSSGLGKAVIQSVLGGFGAFLGGWGGPFFFQNFGSKAE